MNQPPDEWNRSEAPEEGAIVRILASDDHSEYVIPFPVTFRDDSWFNSATGEELDEEVFVEGWRSWSQQDAHQETPEEAHQEAKQP